MKPTDSEKPRSSLYSLLIAIAYFIRGGIISRVKELLTRHSKDTSPAMPFLEEGEEDQMAERIIKCLVDDEYVKGAGVVAGAEGSHDDVLLELTFGDLWDGLTKKITWVDARGGNPTIQILTVDLLKEGETNVYLVPIPYNAKRYEGEMAMSIKGMKVEGSLEQRASMTATAKFIILPSVYNEDADEQGDITATQAAQMQAQIDGLIDDVVAFRGHLDDARESAEAAAISETNAAASASSAAASAEDARGSADAAFDCAVSSDAPVFIATYGVTTYAQVKAALDAGKLVFARRRREDEDSSYYFLSDQLRLIIGDLDFDGDVDNDDLTILARHVSGITDDKRVRIAGDINGDGDISSGDLSALARIIQGTDDPPEDSGLYVFLGMSAEKEGAFEIKVAELFKTDEWTEAEYDNVSSVNGKTGAVTLVAADISDIDEYITGYAGIPTKTSDLINDSGFLTSADVKAADAAPLMDGTAAVGTSTDYAREDHVHPKDTSKANLASPTFTGTPKAPTAAAGTDNTQIATTAFVKTAIDNMLAGSPETTTQPDGDDSAKIATTAFVQAAVAAAAAASRQVIWATDSASNTTGWSQHTITAPAGHDYIYIANVRSSQQSGGETHLELMLEGGLFANTVYQSGSTSRTVTYAEFPGHPYRSGLNYVTGQIVDIIPRANEDQVVNLRTRSTDGYSSIRATHHMTMALIPIN